MSIKILDKVKSAAMEGALRTFKYRNYRLFFGGQVVSLMGTWMQNVAISWLVYRLTNSAFLLGLSTFAALFPSFFISPFAGAIADRLNRQKILITTQTLFMLQAFIMFALVISGSIHIWFIIALNVWNGIVNGFDAPVRQAFVIEMVENKEDLSNAIALNSMMFNSARLIGPSIAGIIVWLFGESFCFFLNGVSFIGVIIALWMMKVKIKEKAEGKPKKLFADIKEGFSYTWNFIPVRTLLILITITSLFGTPFAVLMPLYAKTILNGNAQTLGFLMGGVGLGAFSGAFILAARKSLVGITKKIAQASVFFALMLIAFSFCKVYALSQVLVILAGFSMMTMTASCNTIIQTIIEDKMRGRVMSLYTMAFQGTMPIGSLIIGSMAEKAGAPYSLLIGGTLCLISALWFVSNISKIRSIIQPILVKNGLLKATANV